MISSAASRVLGAWLCLAGTPALVFAQGAAGEARRVSFSVAPTLQGWSFDAPIAQDTVRVTSISQWSVPFVLRAPLGNRWTVDATAAVMRGIVRQESGQELELNGVTDLKLRAIGRLIGDNVVLTLGVNVPTGKVQLAGAELEAARVLGAPALGLQTPVLGTGFGATGGLVFARQAGDWGLAFGSSYELRGSYTPLEATIAGVSRPTDLKPGGAVNLTLGADRLIGDRRFSLVAAAAIFGTDKIDVRGASQTESSTYRLGPIYSATAQLDLGGRRFRELVWYASGRYRSAFESANGEKTAGSSGSSGVFGVRGVLGGAERMGVLMQVEGRFDSGLRVDDNLSTAALNSVQTTLGLEFVAGRMAFLPFARGQFGTIDAGPTAVSASAYSVGLSIGSR